MDHICIHTKEIGSAAHSTEEAAQAPKESTYRPIWLPYKAVKLITKNTSCSTNTKVSHPAYMKVACEADIEMWRTKISFEKKLAKSIDTDCRSFYAYVKTRSQAKPSIGLLIGQDKAQLQLDEVAEEFKRYFTSVFTSENIVDIPSAAPLFLETESREIMRHPHR